MYKIFARLLVCFGMVLIGNTVVEAQTSPCPNCLRSGIELVVNGGFEQGNTGFASTYSYLQGPANVMNEGFYTVITNPNNIHAGFSACPDHTSGTGQQMVLNGATQSNINLWCQSIVVQPNTDYLFSTWLQSVSLGNPAQLQFSINGVNLGAVFSPPNVTCQWTEFFTTWNSGSNTSASICIVNQNTNAGGNDFALDDISFMKCEPIQPLNASVLYADVTCFGNNDGLASPNTGQAWAGVPPYSYAWFDGTTDAVKDSLAPGNYYLVVTDSINCIDTAFFTIAEPPAFIVDLGPDTISCFGLGVSLSNLDTLPPVGITYAWNTGETTQSITADSTGQYVVCGTVGSCTKCDTINVTIQADFTVNIGPPDTTFCHGGAIVLNAGNPFAAYLWNTGDTVYTITVDSAGLYWVSVTFDNCTKYDTIQVSESICTSLVYVPNVFTPNSDTKNDFFMAQYSGIVSNVSIVVYNRWGKEVFSDTKVNWAWDGKINGKSASDAVYYWIMKYTNDKGQKKELTGNVALIGGE